MKKLDINKLVEDTKNELLFKIKKSQKVFTLATIRVGKDKGAISYQKSLVKEAEYFGINVLTYEYENIFEEKLVHLIFKLNEDKNIDGILIFQPLPNYLNSDKIINLINPDKDVDGSTQYNQNRLINIENYRNLPTTAYSILTYLKSILNLESKNVLIINRSNIIGKPLAMMLLKENATITLAHSKTINLEEIMKDKDIIVSGIGNAFCLKPHTLKDGVVIIDMGISMSKDGKFVGDFDLTSIEEKNVYYMPSIGGIGKLNSNIIFKNIILNGGKYGK